MSNPDTTSANANVTANANTANTASTTASTGLYTGLAEATLLFIVIIVVFKFADIAIRTKLLWIALPILAFVIALGMNMGSQYMSCGKTDGKKALMGAIASPVAVWVGLAISSVDSCRIPVASVFAPLFTDSTNDIVKGANSKRTTNSINSTNSSKRPAKCCTPPQAFLSDLEEKYPLLKMCSHIFYVSFSVMFGSVIGTSVATVC